MASPLEQSYSSWVKTKEECVSRPNDNGLLFIIKNIQELSANTMVVRKRVEVIQMEAKDEIRKTITHSSTEELPFAGL